MPSGGHEKVVRLRSEFEPVRERFSPIPDDVTIEKAEIDGASGDDLAAREFRVRGG